MLVLSRKTGERIIIGPNITVTVIGVKGDRVRLGFEAPHETPIHREELIHHARPPMAMDRGEANCDSPFFAECA